MVVVMIKAIFAQILLVKPSPVVHL